MDDFETGGTPEPERGGAPEPETHGEASPGDPERRLWLFGALGFVGLVVLVALALAVVGAVFGSGQAAGQDERRNECVAAYRNLLTRARRRYHRRPAHFCRVRASGHRGEACFTVGLARSEVGSSVRSRRFSCASQFSARGERGAISADG